MRRDADDCLRDNGTMRSCFNSRAEAEAFGQDPMNVSYHGDVANLCQRCGYWHLSKPEWLRPLPFGKCAACGLDLGHDFMVLKNGVQVHHGKCAKVAEIERLVKL